MNKFLLSPLFLAVALQGCGSDSSGGDSGPSEPVEYTFSLNAKLTNDCGVSTTFTDVELLLQDDTWQTLNSYTPDENGLISFVTESEFINYTLVAKSQEGSDSEGLDVVSFYQASSATPSTYYAQLATQVDNSTCECVTQNVVLSHALIDTQTSVTSSSTFDEWEVVDESTTLFKNVEVCHEIGEGWPSHSFSVTGTNDGNDLASAAFYDSFDENFDENPDGIWNVSAFAVATSVELSQPHQQFSTNQLVHNDKHFSEIIAEDADSLLVFKNHEYSSEVFYQSQASVSFTESDSIFGSAVIKTHHQIISEDDDQSFEVKADENKPNIDDIYFSEISADGSYDYSGVSGYPMTAITFVFTAYDPDSGLLMPAKWTFYGPESGTLAITAPLTGYENIIDIDTAKKSTEVHLIESGAASDYQDYIEYYQVGNTVDSAIDVTNSFVQDIEKVEISISLN